MGHRTTIIGTHYKASVHVNKPNPALPLHACSLSHLCFTGISVWLGQTINIVLVVSKRVIVNESSPFAEVSNLGY